VEESLLHHEGLWYINLLMEDISLCSINFQYNRERVPHSH